MSPTHDPDILPVVSPRRVIIHWQNSFLDKEQTFLLAADDDRTDEEARQGWIDLYNSRMRHDHPMYRRLFKV